MALMKWKDANHVSKVKGPIRCHKCQLMCRDAKHYLGHKCGSHNLEQAIVRRVIVTRIAG
jgi:Zn finger protein HypA/HybF involved in hydrogenase expression